MQHPDPSAWIALQRTPGISAHTLRKLILHRCVPDRRGVPKAELADLSLRPETREILARPIRREVLRRVDRDRERMQRLDVELLSITHPDYPPLLKQTADPPPLLYVQGNRAALHWPQLAMVGSRRCSRQGRDNAFTMAQALVRAGLAVTSGCALGIDAAGHEGALSIEGGMSIGVLGTGIDVVYPRRNRTLFEQLPRVGALVSEFPLGTQPHRALFPQRNRLISGLSLGVLVVEAALKSGSLITARFALEQNRDVFAIPGSIHNLNSEGCHHLIQQGAQLVTSTTDILLALESWLPERQSGGVVDALQKVGAHSAPELEPEEAVLLEMIGFELQDIDDLLEQSGRSIGELQSLLTRLELKGCVEQVAGCVQRLATAG